MEPTSIFLDGLAPELLNLILLQIPSIRDLHSLIQASAQCYRVFVLLKRRILSSLVHHVFSPDVLREAYHVVEASRFDTRGPPRQQVLQFVKTIEDDALFDNLETLIPLPTSILLLQLHRSLDYFTHDFARQSIPALRKRTLALGLAPAQDSEGASLTLSTTEESRLQRALCQFELYGHLFCTKVEDEYGHIHFNGMSQLTALEQANLFFNRLVPWRVEEVACVRDYLVRRLENLFDRVEDDYVKSVIAERFKGVAATCPYDTFCYRDHDFKDDGVPGGSSNENNYELENGDEDDEDEDEDYGEPDRFEFDDYFFSQYAKDDDHSRYMEYMLHLGLPFLRKLFEAEGEERMRLVVSNGLLCADFLTEALKVYHPKQSIFPACATGPQRSLEYEFTGDNVLGPNEAWSWLIKTEHAIWDFEQGSRLRDWGFVFWDSSRLGASKILSKSPQEVKSSEVPGRSRNREPTAEERLKLMRPLFKPAGLEPVEPIESP
ncbi:MAG: hypothetical protein Q9187_005977 [Circinaria calcarea]